MKHSKIILSAAALSSLLWLGTGVAQAAGESNSGYLQDSRGNVVKDAYNLCWRTGYWTPGMATSECDPDLVKKPAAMPVAQSAPTPAPAPMPMGPEKPAFEKITLQAETLFDFDKAVVRPDGKKALDDVVAKMKQYPQVEVVLVTGYTDRIGTEAYNQKLSERRADAVKAYLVNQGIASDRIETKGMGKADPVVSCDNIKGRVNRHNKKLVECLQPNRRVVVEIKVQRPTDK